MKGLGLGSSYWMSGHAQVYEKPVGLGFGYLCRNCGLSLFRLLMSWKRLVQRVSKWFANHGTEFFRAIGVHLCTGFADAVQRWKQTSTFCTVNALHEHMGAKRNFIIIINIRTVVFVRCITVLALQKVLTYSLAGHCNCTRAFKGSGRRGQWASLNVVAHHILEEWERFLLGQTNR